MMALRTGRRLGFVQSAAGRVSRALPFYGTTELTEVPQLARPSLVPQQVAVVRVNADPVGHPVVPHPLAGHVKIIPIG
jgi:hypothetical protein